MKMAQFSRTMRIATLALLMSTSPNVNADYVFGTPTAIPASSWFTSPSVSTDGLSLYVDAPQSYGGYGGYDIYVLTRDTIHDDWSAPVNLGLPINSSYGDGNPDISADGLTLFFSSSRSGGQGDSDIWVTTRATTDDPWSEPVNLGPTINSPYYDSHPSVSADGLSLFLCSTRPGGYGDRDIYLSTRATTNDPWSEPVNLGPIVNSPSFDSGPDISSDGLTLFFDSRRPGGYGGRDIWVASRATTDDLWGVPVNLGSTVNSSADEFTACISEDGSIFYLWSSGRLRQVPIIPIVDFNGDGEVDGKEVLILVAHWGQNRPSCDIGPMPLGDRVVDEQDLFALAEYLEGEGFVDPTLIAHWALDETEGAVAYDSVGDNGGTVLGVPAWRPEGGQVNGALEFDGTTFCVVDPVLNPSDGPFSVLAWVKGGAPDQAIVAQQGGAAWLKLDASEGKLASELSIDQDGYPLRSETVVTDGNWHRIGFTWDGSACLLYLDDVLVAEAAEDGLVGSTAGLVIGCGPTMAAGTRFTGLIDDVRIYNRAVKP